MFYIDDYNSKAITNSPPKREDKMELAKAKKVMESKQLSVFWYLAGTTIANRFVEVKALLSKYGYKVVNEEDAAAAISDMIGTAKWVKFVKEFGEIMEDSIDERIINDINESSEESGWIEALIQAVGSVASSSLNVAASNKQLKGTKENAKAQMFTGVAAILAEKERTKAEAEKTRREEKKGTIWIVLSIVIALAVIIAIIIIYKRRKAKSELS